jgi:hypothetical protein
MRTRWLLVASCGVAIASAVGCKDKGAGDVADAAPAVAEPPDAGPSLPADEPSKQTIRFHIPSRPGELRHQFLPGFAVSRVEGDGGLTRLVTEAPRDCACTPCPPPKAEREASVPEMSWDVREMTVTPVPCPGKPGVSSAHAAAHPAAPGLYSAMFMVTSCAGAKADTHGKVVVPDAGAEGGGCRDVDPRPVEVRFQVPQSGDVDVSLP